MSAKTLVAALGRRGLTLGVAESFTGGLLQDAITDVPGSSAVFLGGIVAYHDDLKRALLGVPARLIRRHGAASGPVALAMARGVRRRLRADVGIATTGIAGPTGARPGKPVGLGFVAVATAKDARFRRRVFRGARTQVKRAAVREALRLAQAALARKR